MSRLLKALLGVAIALVLAGAPVAASAAPAREEGALSALEVAWGWVVELWGGVVGAEKSRGMIVPSAGPECLDPDCGAPTGDNTDTGPAWDPYG